MISALEHRYIQHVAALEKESRAQKKLKHWYSELTTRHFWIANLAEFLGTALMVFVGTAASLRGLLEGWEPTPFTIAVTFGLAVAAVIQAFGHISGAHVDPAISLALALLGEISPLCCFSYILFQCAGGVVGSAMLYGLTPRESQGTLGATLMTTKVTVTQGFFLEVVLTYLLVISVVGTLDARRNPSGLSALTLGLCVTACLTVGIPLEGPGINPARSLGPAVITGDFPHYFWIYWAGPMVGGAIAAISYRFVFDPYRPSRATPDHEISLSYCQSHANGIVGNGSSGAGTTTSSQTTVVAEQLPTPISSEFTRF